MSRTSWIVSLVILGACAPEGGAQNDLLRGAGMGAAAGMTSSVGGNPASTGQAGRTAGGQVTAGVGTGAPSAAGSGTAGTATAGSAAAGAAGTSAAGNSAAAGSGSVAGAGAAGMVGAAGAAGAMGAAGTMGAAGSGASTPGSITLAFKTVSYGGEYAPLNYVVVWFEDGSGKFIKTAARWAGAAHAADLAAWTEASGGWGSPFLGGGNMADMMDAMSSATLREHQMHMVTWNMMDAQKALVPDGDYVAVVEMTESRARDNEGKLLRIPFKKSAEQQTVEVPDDASFTGVSLRYAP